MNHLFSFGIILAVSCVGELLRLLIPLPIPATIYGLLIMLGLLMSGALKLEKVEGAALFLVSVMPVLFVPAGVGLISAWPAFRPVAVPVLAITLVTTLVVMAVTGKVTDHLMKEEKE